MDIVTRVLREEILKQAAVPAKRRSRRPRFTAGMMARIVVEGDAPIKSGEVHIVPEGQGDPGATPARLACNAKLIKELERVGIGGRVQLGEGRRTYTVMLVDIHDVTAH